MQDVDLDQAGITGALDVDRTPDGVVLRRLPDWTRHQIIDPALAILLTMPAGVRLELETDTIALELDVQLTVLQLGDAATVPAAFDLVVSGDVVDTKTTTEGTRIVVDMRTQSVDIQPGGPTTIRFTGVPGTPGTPVEVWLPHAAVVELRAVRVDDGASAAPARSSRRRCVQPPELDQPLRRGDAADGLSIFGPTTSTIFRTSCTPTQRDAGAWGSASTSWRSRPAPRSPSREGSPSSPGARARRRAGRRGCRGSSARSSALWSSPVLTAGSAPVRASRRPRPRSPR